MFIEYVEAVNFLAHRRLELDFTKFKGVVVVEGDNGAGKTAIMEAICWLLFGRILRGRGTRSPEVRNRFTDEPCYVRGAIRLADGHTLTVLRRRTGRGTTLEVSGLEGGGTTTGTQEHLERLLETDYDLFTRSVVFGGDVSAFCRMGEAERKALLEDLLQLSHYMRASKRAHDLALGHRAEVEAGQESLRMLRARLEGIRQNVEEARSEAANRERVYRRDLASKMDAVQVYTDALYSLLESAIELREKAEKEEALYLAAVERHEAEIETARTERAKAQRLLASAREVRVQKEAERRGLRKEVNDLESDKHPDTCPKCGQRWPQTVKNTEHLLAHNRRLLEEVEEAVIVAQNEENRRESVYDRFDAQLQALGRKAPARGEFTVELNRVLSSLEAKYAALHVAWEDVANIRASYRSAKGSGLLGKLEEESQSVQGQIKEMEGKVEAARHREALYAFWKAGFSKHGIPARLMETSIPLLNTYLQRYLSILSEGEARAAFSLDADSFKLEAAYRNGGDSYEFSSRGEHTRIDVAVLLAIRQLMASRMRRAWSQVFMDEVFDGLSDGSSERVFALLRQEFSDQQVFLITHSPRLRGHSDSSILVEKNGRDTLLTVRA